jgi:hypothetical protein
MDRAFSQDSQLSQTPLSEGDPAAPLTPDEEKTIRHLLVRIGETDPEVVADVIDRCRRDADARAYFLERAAAELPEASEAGLC